MKTIGNIVWFICGGFLAALMWLMSGLICCVTVVGIPLGKQCFKFARLSAAPFGKDIRFSDATDDEVTVTVKVNPIAMKMWALKYSRYIKVIFPQSLVDEIKADIDFAKKNYEEETL